MNNTIEIPIEEYEAMKEELALLKDNALLEKMNKLVDLLYEEKYGLYLGNETWDLTEASIQKNGHLKTVHGIMYKQREIVLVPFPYSNLSSSKRRPVLIISNNNYNKNYSDILVAVITSNLFKDDYSVELYNDDWN